MPVVFVFLVHALRASVKSNTPCFLGKFKLYGLNSQTLNFEPWYCPMG